MLCKLSTHTFDTGVSKRLMRTRNPPALLGTAINRFGRRNPPALLGTVINRFGRRNPLPLLGTAINRFGRYVVFLFNEGVTLEILTFSFAFRTSFSIISVAFELMSVDGTLTVTYEVKLKNCTT